MDTICYRDIKIDQSKLTPEAKATLVKWGEGSEPVNTDTVNQFFSALAVGLDLEFFDMVVNKKNTLLIEHMSSWFQYNYIQDSLGELMLLVDEEGDVFHSGDIILRLRPKDPLVVQLKLGEGNPGSYMFKWNTGGWLEYQPTSAGFSCLLNHIALFMNPRDSFIYTDEDKQLKRFIYPVPELIDKNVALEPSEKEAKQENGVVTIPKFYIANRSVNAKVSLPVEPLPTQENYRIDNQGQFGIFTQVNPISFNLIDPSLLCYEYFGYFAWHTIKDKIYDYSDYNIAYRTHSDGKRYIDIHLGGQDGSHQIPERSIPAIIKIPSSTKSEWQSEIFQSPMCNASWENFSLEGVDVKMHQKVTWHTHTTFDPQRMEIVSMALQEESVGNSLAYCFRQGEAISSSLQEQIKRAYSTDTNNKLFTANGTDFPFNSFPMEEERLSSLSKPYIASGRVQYGSELEIQNRIQGIKEAPIDSRWDHKLVNGTKITVNWKTKQIPNAFVFYNPSPTSQFNDFIWQLPDLCSDIDDENVPNIEIDTRIPIISDKTQGVVEFHSDTVHVQGSRQIDYSPRKPGVKMRISGVSSKNKFPAKYQISPGKLDFYALVFIESDLAFSKNL